MSLTQVPLAPFGGLEVGPRLEAVPAERARDGVNFDIREGVLQSRDGFSGLLYANDPRFAIGCQAQAYRSADSKFYTVLGASDGTLNLWSEDSAGTFTFGGATNQGTNVTTPSTNVTSITPYGSPGASGFISSSTARCRRVILPNIIDGPAAVMKDAITGATVTVLSADGLPTCAAVGNWAGQGRTVYAGCTVAPDTGYPASGEHVWFSEPGAPITFRTDAFVVVGAGDGEPVTAVASWRENIIVFKANKFFVFYGVSSSARGVPIFNYRVVDTGVGCVSAQAVAAGPDGLYFVAEDGIYLTRGDSPQKISGRVDGIFSGDAPAVSIVKPFTTGRIPMRDRVFLSYAQDRLVMGFLGGPLVSVTEQFLVWDRRHDFWSVWQGSSGGYRSFPMRRINGHVEHWFDVVVPNGAGGFRHEVGPQTLGQAYDVTRGLPATQLGFTASYLTGLQDLAGDSRARVRQIELWGSLSAHTLDAYGDGGVLAQTGSVTTVSGRVLFRKALVSERASIKVSGTAPWSLSRADYQVSNKRVSSA